jgi:hypothetical protein
MVKYEVNTKTESPINIKREERRSRYAGAEL